jgi:thermitase
MPSQGVFLSNGATIVEEYPEIGMVKVVSLRGVAAEQLARLLTRKTGVISAEPDRYLRTPESQGMPISFNDGEFDRDDSEHQQFLERLHVPEAHAFALGRNTRVAILDTGVDPDHPALSGRIHARNDLVDQDSSPWETADGVDNDGDGQVDEALGHGTHVAGLIAMLAPEADLDIYRILDDEGWGAASNVAKAILNAVKDGADVINLSLGMYDPFRAVEKALDYATDRGVVVVGAAGNDGVSEPGQYPASFARALGVGSADNADRLSAFSNFGPSVHVTAPGEQLLSTYPGGGYASASGTSMASAIVSALAALVVERHGDGQHPGSLAGDVAGRIARASVAGTGVPGLTGHGRVDFLEAVRD